MPLQCDAGSVYALPLLPQTLCEICHGLCYKLCVQAAASEGSDEPTASLALEGGEGAAL